MTIHLTTLAPDQGTYAITASFTDEAGETVTPNSLTWSMYNRAGRVCNSRENVSLTPASSVTVVLTGDDLKYTDGAQRFVVFDGDYDSSNGSNLPLRDECMFFISDLRD